MIDFENQVAIVTGAGRGMGRAIALELARRGAAVLVNDYGGSPEGEPGTSDVATEVAEHIRAAGGRAAASSHPIGTADSADAIVRTTLEAFGRVDILVNNAGVGVIAPIDELEERDIERVMRINYWGAYLLIRRVWPLMKRQSYGRIVNVSSSGVLGIGMLAAFASSKAALLGLTAEAAIEGKEHNIAVNATFPAGYTRLAAKSQEDQRRWMEKYFQPELVASAVAFLVSRDVNFTGEIFSVGGGRVSRIAMVNNDGYFDRDLSAESVGSHIDEIRDLTPMALS